jgi:hypothetical protein
MLEQLKKMADAGDERAIIALHKIAKAKNGLLLTPIIGREASDGSYEIPPLMPGKERGRALRELEQDSPYIYVVLDPRNDMENRQRKYLAAQLDQLETEKKVTHPKPNSWSVRTRGNKKSFRIPFRKANSLVTFFPGIPTPVTVRHACKLLRGKFANLFREAQQEEITSSLPQQIDLQLAASPPLAGAQMLVLEKQNENLRLRLEQLEAALAAQVEPESEPKPKPEPKQENPLKPKKARAKKKKG